MLSHIPSTKCLIIIGSLVHLWILLLLWCRETLVDNFYLKFRRKQFRRLEFSENVGFFPGQDDAIDAFALSAFGFPWMVVAQIELLDGAAALWRLLKLLQFFDFIPPQDALNQVQTGTTPKNLTTRWVFCWCEGRPLTSVNVKSTTISVIHVFVTPIRRRLLWK